MKTFQSFRPYQIDPWTSDQSDESMPQISSQSSLWTLCDQANTDPLDDDAYEEGKDEPMETSCNLKARAIGEDGKPKKVT